MTSVYLITACWR